MAKPSLMRVLEDEDKIIVTTNMRQVSFLLLISFIFVMSTLIYYYIQLEGSIGATLAVVGIILFLIVIVLLTLLVYKTTTIDKSGIKLKRVLLPSYSVSWEDISSIEVFSSNVEEEFSGYFDFVFIYKGKKTIISLSETPQLRYFIESYYNKDIIEKHS